VVTILIISAIVKRSLWRASPLARGARFYSGGPGPPWSPPLAPALSTGKRKSHKISSKSVFKNYFEDTIFILYL